jgi:hypothetical protein
MPRTPIHPGEILADELDEIGLSAKRLADSHRSSGEPALSNPGGKAERNRRHGPTPRPVLRDVRRFLDEPPERLGTGCGASAGRQGHTANSEALVHRLKPVPRSLLAADQPVDDGDEGVEAIV